MKKPASILMFIFKSIQFNDYIYYYINFFISLKLDCNRLLYSVSVFQLFVKHNRFTIHNHTSDSASLNSNDLSSVREYAKRVETESSSLPSSSCSSSNSALVLPLSSILAVVGRLIFCFPLVGRSVVGTFHGGVLLTGMVIGGGGGVARRAACRPASNTAANRGGAASLHLGDDQSTRQRMGRTVEVMRWRSDGGRDTIHGELK